jgi:23S rRNA (cytidine1920-2'-O)/16S rRNA (cytidine1409-2'-O)-methyltransferase
VQHNDYAKADEDDGLPDYVEKASGMLARCDAPVRYLAPRCSSLARAAILEYPLSAMSKKRLDVLMAERELVESRNKAQRLIQAGEVRVDGQLVDKPSTPVPDEADITLQAKPPFVSRGGEKLEAALERFGIDVAHAVAADVGASTGGFTDCLLQGGARRVYAIDSGYGQLHWHLRNDARVVVMERTNARYLVSLPEPVDMVTVDVSFISLALILPRAVGWLTPDGDVVALIKPQFEAGPQHVEKGGVVRDPEVHRRVLEGVLDVATELGLHLRGLMPSPLQGPAGNVEFLAWWRPGGHAVDNESAIVACLAEVR